MRAHEHTKMEAPVKLSASPSNTVVIFTKASSSEKWSVEADQDASTSPFEDKVALSSELTLSTPSEMLLIAEARWRANFTRQNPVPKERAC